MTRGPEDQRFFGRSPEAVGPAARRRPETRGHCRRRSGRLVCGYQLQKRGHELTILDASGRTGGHVRTQREGLDDGFYADAGAEHFTKPGYDICWNYFKEFDRPILDYPHQVNMLRVVDGRMVAEQEAAAINRSKTAGAAFNQRERDYLKEHPGGRLSGLHVDKYIKKITDEYQPFVDGLTELDALSVTELLKRDGVPKRPSSGMVLPTPRSTTSGSRRSCECAI
jgi:monoamine oxidase